MLEINLKQLEVFVCVAECRSFSVAAEQLYLSQPTVSSHIAALEDSLGVTLLERGSRKKVTLTERGQEFYRRSRAIVQNCRELEGLCAPEELRIGASSVPMDCILPELMAAFGRENPDCRYVLHKGNSRKVHEMLEEGKIQLGFVGTVMDRQHLVYRRLCCDHLVLVTPDTQEYRQLRREKTLGRALLTRPLIVRTAGSGTQLAVDRYLSEAGIPTEEIRVVARIESSQTILQSVSRGLGNAVVSAMAAEPWVRQGKLLAFELEQTPVTRELYLIFPKQRAAGAMAQQFMDFAQTYARQKLPQSGERERGLCPDRL